MGRAGTALIAAVAGFLLFPPLADAQLACEFQLASAGGQALTCPLGGVRNVVDIDIRHARDNGYPSKRAGGA